MNRNEFVMENIIEVRNLRKAYRGKTVLNGINFAIRRGDVVSIIGPSESGKSTFLRCLNLLERPDAGEILVGGKNILAPDTDIAKIRQKMGMVFQSFNLFDHLTVLENVTIGPRKLLGQSKDEAMVRGLDLLQLVGLGNKAMVKPSQLSGSQKQRAAIARCLSMAPEIILFDEPTSALDLTMVSEVWGVIQQLAKQGMTMAIVTHEMEFVRNISSRILFMGKEGVYEEGTPDQIFDHPQLEQTRTFINQIHSFTYVIDNERYDFFELQNTLNMFAIRCFLKESERYNLSLLIEEILQIAPVATGLTLTVDYAEKSKTKSVAILLPDGVASFVDPEAGADELSMQIIHGLSSDISDEVLPNGQRKITFVLNSQIQSR